MQNIYTVYDSKAEAYMQPFFSQTAGTAARAFEKAVNDPQHDFHQNAGDYTLFEIGQWDEHTGKIQMFDAKNALGVATQYLKNPIADAIVHDIKQGAAS